jgi:hypothetical protein
MWIFVVLAGALLTWSTVSHSRAQKRNAKATAAAAEAARLAEEKRVRDAFSADSLAAATRLTRFMDKYQPAPVENSPVLAVPIPVGMPVRSFLEQVWSDYTRVVEPQATSERESELFRQYYLDIMNDGPLRPTAILLPPLKQDKTNIVVDRPGFPAITRAQVAVGYREPPPEAPADSLAAAAAAAGGEAAPAEAGAEPAPAAGGEAPPAEATPPAPEEAPPAVEPPAEPAPPAEAAPPAEPAPPDTTPKG